MTYLLIDTDCLKRLVSTIQESYYLKLLQLWEQRGLIKLFYPEPLKEEWEKHRINEIERITKEIKEDYIRFQRYNIDESQANNAKSKLLNQITIIDSLLEKAIFIAESSELKIKLFDLRRKRKVPFQKKQASDNDALMIFSSLEYCHINNIENLIFLSHNSTEFESPSTKNKLHPDIANDYQNVQVKYFTELNESFKFFKESLSFPDIIKDSSSIVEETKLNYYDTDKPFLEELYKSLHSFFKEIKYVHPSIFLKYIPSSEEVNINTHEGFRLFTYNQHLYNLLSSIKIENGKFTTTDEIWIKDINNFHEKIALIVKALNENCIWYIENNKESQLVDITKLIEHKDDHDFIEDFDFDNALKDLENSEIPLFEKG